MSILEGRAGKPIPSYTNQRKHSSLFFLIDLNIGQAFHEKEAAKWKDKAISRAVAKCFQQHLHGIGCSGGWEWRGFHRPRSWRNAQKAIDEEYGFGGKASLPPTFSYSTASRFFYRPRADSYWKHFSKN
ncbi:hypothetical protein TcWFU_007792 [Taenia crassiceps]|uniref:Uncharacterized protein n=1 Tax=Taenia crassiceps TaxID=6207 RepID=A0ABR4Q780_9CEST